MEICVGFNEFREWPDVQYARSVEPRTLEDRDVQVIYGLE